MIQSSGTSWVVQIIGELRVVVRRVERRKGGHPGSALVVALVPSLQRQPRQRGERSNRWPCPLGPMAARCPFRAALRVLATALALALGLVLALQQQQQPLVVSPRLRLPRRVAFNFVAASVGAT
jgi:hypothetical protein